MISTSSSRAKVIAFEGRDRIGKATQTRLLVSALVAEGKRVTTLEFPLSRTLTGRTIYAGLETGWAKRWPLAFQALHLVNKFVPQQACMSYLLKTQDYVILDRWNSSSLVYGRITEVPEWFSRFTSEVLLDPDAILVLDGPGYGGAGGDSYERDSQLQSRVREEYLKEARQNPRTHAVIDATGFAEAVHSRVWGALIDRDLV